MCSEVPPRIILRGAPLLLQVSKCLLLVENHILVLGSCGSRDPKTNSHTHQFRIQWRCTSKTLGPTCSCHLAQYGHKRYNQIYADDSSLPFSRSMSPRESHSSEARESSVDQIHRRVDYICPKLLGKIRGNPHAPCTLQNSSIHALRRSILMRVFENHIHFFGFFDLCRTLWICHRSIRTRCRTFKHLSFLPDSFLTWTSHFLKTLKTSDLCFKKYTKTFLLESSMKVTKYNEPPRENWSLTPDIGMH